MPNATLISGNLINWTLAERTRRLDLLIGVAFGNDPQRVIALLIETAASVAGVLGKPAPVAFFQGFGDSALNFEVRAWTDRFEEWVSIRSQMAVAVNNRLKAEGIGFRPRNATSTCTMHRERRHDRGDPSRTRHYFRPARQSTRCRRT